MKKFLVVEENGFISQIYFDDNIKTKENQKIFVTDYEYFDFGKDYWLVNNELIEVELGSKNPGDSKC